MFKKVKNIHKEALNKKLKENGSPYSCHYDIKKEFKISKAKPIIGGEYSPICNYVTVIYIHH